MESKRIFNFSAGPAALPTEVLRRARRELLSLGGIGMSVMEISHRSKYFEPILEGARRGIRDLLNVPENYKILFLQGGASLQFAMIPLNFLKTSADYILTGAWGEKAIKEAKRRGNVNIVFSSKGNGFRVIPSQEEIRLSPNADYVHYTSNETIDGVEFKYDFDGGNAPVICDASSNILSKPIDVSKYALIYAGAQKNIGPSGVTLVIIREDLLEKAPANQFAMLDYRQFAKHDSMPNTLNTWGIYIGNLVCEWLKAKGGAAAMQKLNEAKAKIFSDALDKSDGFYQGHAERNARSLMNVTFRLPSAELDAKFAAQASENNLDGLKGHRSVGGIRASIYNAFPLEGVEKLVEFMQNFARENG
ncbi:MAG: 3-phosphoserine/phosphohydroxythreonine transaminase [Pyrinomonadaceae bacterium]